MKIGITTFGIGPWLKKDFDGTLLRLKDMVITAIEPCVLPIENKILGKIMHCISMLGGIFL
jgi:hypothetical protein